MASDEDYTDLPDADSQQLAGSDDEGAATLDDLEQEGAASAEFPTTQSLEAIDGTQGGQSFDLDGEDLDGDEGEEYVDPKPFIQKLRQAWMNEKTAPELLQYEAEAFSIVHSEVNEQDEATRQKRFENETDKFIFNLYQMEIERLRFLLASYLRTRLWKIEKYALHIRLDAEAQLRLSDKEREYALRYANLVEDHQQRSFLTNIPDGFTQDAGGVRVTKPKLRSYVFCQFDEHLGRIEIGDAEESVKVDVNAGDIYIIRYETVRTLLERGTAHLI
eukprot:m.279103 g.279103  ORF g.279103 m.279103 type:complete len:275 (+) comp15739_c4_seq9:202-1026(+)